MKRILGGLALVGAINLALGLLAAALLTFSFLAGSLVSRVGGVDRFQGALLSLLALVASVVILWRFLAGAVAHLASRQAQRQAQRQARNAAEPAPLGDEEAEFPQAEGEERSELSGSRRRGRPFDA